MGGHPLSPGSALLEQPAFWKSQYLYTLQDPAAFDRVCRQRGYVSLTAGKIHPIVSSNPIDSLPYPIHYLTHNYKLSVCVLHQALNNQYVLSNFTSRQQCADAFFGEDRASTQKLHIFVITKTCRGVCSKNIIRPRLG